MTLLDARARSELLGASDEEIDEVVKFADAMVLRGLLYQLTGDASVAVAISTVVGADSKMNAAINEGDVAMLQAKAATFLKAYRDSGASGLDIGPRDRLQRSLGLAVGEDIPDDEFPLWLEELALDDRARSLVWQETPDPDRLQDFSVVVIGAGMGGLLAAVQLKRAGIPFTVIEKNSGIGGTWFENRYPGARVDTPSRGYTYICGFDYPYSSPYCTWDENSRYFNWIADSFGIRNEIVFDTEVKKLVWDDESSTWQITTEGPQGEQLRRAAAVISCVGFLNRPNVPEFEGMTEFRGQSCHTARWPEDLEVAGKRVAVIGTGCTGYQLVPELALEAEHVVVCQRTPQWIFTARGYRSPFPPQVTWLDRNLPYYANFMRLRAQWFIGSRSAALAYTIDPQFEDPHTRSATNKEMREFCIDFLERKLAGRPALVEKMIPPHPPYSARPVLVDAEYSIIDALLRDNVTLVTDGIRRITRSGIEAADGAEYEVDVIVYATGFQANEYLFPMEIRGRDDKQLSDLWAEGGPRAYLGTMLPGFPNFWIVYGPNTNFGLNVAPLHEIVISFALQCIERLILDDKRAIEVTEEAYWRYNEDVDRRNELMMWADRRASNYYRNKYGRSSTNCPLSGPETWSLLRRPNFEEMVIR